MRKKILNILLGKFLIDQINSNNLKLILFVFSMAFTLIFLSHSVDSKIYKINTLSNDVSSVESNFIAIMIFFWFIIKARVFKKPFY